MGAAVVTVPPHGSQTVCLSAEKSPDSSAGVGTVVVNAVPVRKRNPSQLKNQKVLSRPSYSFGTTRGPPAFAPNWFCVNGGLFWPALFKKKSLASSTLFRRYSYASPCN